MEIKENIREGVSIDFTQLENGKFSFSSKNKELQEWINSRNKKKIRAREIYFVVKAAKELLNKASEDEQENDQDDDGCWNCKNAIIDQVEEDGTISRYECARTLETCGPEYCCKCWII